MSLKSWLLRQILAEITQEAQKLLVKKTSQLPCSITQISAGSQSKTNPCVLQLKHKAQMFMVSYSPWPVWILQCLANLWFPVLLCGLLPARLMSMSSSAGGGAAGAGALGGISVLHAGGSGQCLQYHGLDWKGSLDGKCGTNNSFLPGKLIGWKDSGVNPQNSSWEP